MCAGCTQAAMTVPFGEQRGAGSPLTVKGCASHWLPELGPGQWGSALPGAGQSAAAWLDPGWNRVEPPAQRTSGSPERKSLLSRPIYNRTKLEKKAK